jgi:hypothetical protein
MAAPKPPATVKPSADGVPKPPSAASPRSKKPAGSSIDGEIATLNKKLDALRKKQKDGEVKNQQKHDSEILKINSELQKLNNRKNA